MKKLLNLMSNLDKLVKISENNTKKSIVWKLNWT